MPLAFPTAEGFGQDSVGGRGGALLRVTNLEDSGAGSFRAAVTASGPRIVVFTVSGTIQLLSRITIYSPYLTIAGQTSPGGVQIRGTGSIPTGILFFYPSCLCEMGLTCYLGKIYGICHQLLCLPSHTDMTWFRLIRCSSIRFVTSVSSVEPDSDHSLSHSVTHFSLSCLLTYFVL